MAQSNISFVDECLGQWVEFINAHVLSPFINYKVFSDTLENLVKPIKSGQLTNEEVNIIVIKIKNVYILIFIKKKKLCLY